MAGNKTLQGNAGALQDVDTLAAYPLGRNPLLFEVPDEDGNIYKYVSGVASVVQGDWVIINADGSVARAVSTPLAGPVGVAMGAIIASTFGWVQVHGLVGTGALGNGQTQANIASDAAADKKPLYMSATAGRATTTQAAGQTILGAWGSGAAASNLGNAWMSRPFAPGFTLASA